MQAISAEYFEQLRRAGSAFDGAKASIRAAAAYLAQTMERMFFPDEDY